MLPDLAIELAVGAISLDDVLALVVVSDMDDLVPVLVLLAPALPKVLLAVLAKLTLVPNDDTRERLLAPVLDVPVVDPFLLPALEPVARELAVPTKELPALELTAEFVLLTVVDPKDGIGDLDLVLDVAVEREGLTGAVGWRKRETEGARDVAVLFEVEKGNFFEGGPILPSFFGSATTVGVGLDVGTPDVGALEVPTPLNAFWTIDFAEDRNPNRDAIPLAFAVHSKANSTFERE
jgi:hypothetical protein